MNARMMTATRIKWNLVGGRFRIRCETEAATLVKGRSFKELHIKKGHAVTTYITACDGIDVAASGPDALYKITH